MPSTSAGRSTLTLRPRLISPLASRTRRCDEVTLSAIWGAAMLTDRLIDQPKEAVQQAAAEPTSPHADPELSASYARP